MKISLHRTVFICLLALLFLLSGCATTRKLSDEDRNKISVVRINSPAQRAPAMYYLGPGTGLLFALGPVGGAVAAATSVKPGKELQDYAEKNGVFIEKIAIQEIDAALRQSEKLKVSDSDEAAETTINVWVYQFGFSIPHGFSSKLVPIVSIRCEMVNATGKVIWSARDGVRPLGNPVEAMSLEEMRANPKLIEEAWREASKHVARNIVKDL